jgi:TolB-like protein
VRDRTAVIVGSRTGANSASMETASAQDRIRRGDVVKTEIDETREIDEGEIRTACASIMASDAFQKAHRMRRLFDFLTRQVLAGEKAISEYAIGIEVFGRNPADYLSEDPSVRVQVGRLRHRLAAYYTDHATTGDVEITIPVGRYTPSFRRVVRHERTHPQGTYLLVQPIRYITEREEGQAFASGLYEELLNQLFSSFGDVFTRAAPPAAWSGNAAGDADEDRTARHRLIEGSLRVDAERMRTSIRLIDASLSRITWARHFDRSVQFGIREQEELAASICRALKDAVSL